MAAATNIGVLTDADIDDIVAPYAVDSKIRPNYTHRNGGPWEKAVGFEPARTLCL